MYAFKRILVGVDLSDFDQNVISYTSFLSGLVGAESVYFIHIAASLELPKRVVDAEMFAPVDEGIERVIQENIDKYFDANGCTTDIEVIEGNATDKILRWSKIKETDLIIMGRKKETDGHGILPGKVANICHCSMLLVPPNTTPKVDIISVPTDFSDFSRIAMEKAVKLGALSGANVISQHIYSVPMGYHSSGKTYAEFCEIMKKNAIEDYDDFMQTIEHDKGSVSLSLVLQEDDIEPVALLAKSFSEIKADLIIMGSKGRTALASMLLGSFVEKMIKVNATVPLLIVKDKEENMTFFEALMAI